MPGKILILLFIPFLMTPVSRACNHAQIATWLQEQNFTEIIACADKTTDQEQDDYLLNAIGYAAYQSSMTEMANTYFQKSLARNDHNPQALLYLGLINKQNHLYEKSIGYYELLIAQKPGNARYYRNMAECYGELKKPDSSYRYNFLAYNAAPSDAAIANAYVENLVEKKKFITADSVIQRFLIEKPNNPILLAAAIKSAYLQKQYRKVLPVMDLLVVSGPITYTPTLYSLISALQLKEYQRCINYANLLIGAGNETEQVLYYASKAYAGLKQYDQSIKMLQQCIKSAISENAEAYYTELGENLSAMKKYSGAQLYYDTARYLSGNAMLLYRKALLYDAAKQERQARKAYADFLKQPGTKDPAVVQYAKSRITSTTK